MKKLYLGIIFIAILAVALFWYASPSGTGFLVKSSIPDDKIVVAYRPHVAYLPVLVAFERNLFEKHGLQREEMVFEQTKDLLLAITSSKADVSFGGINTLEATLVSRKSNGAVIPFAYTFIDNEHSTTCLVSRNFTDVRQLSGKRIGHISGPFGLAWANSTFQALGLDSSGFVPLQTDILLPSLMAGKVDAVFMLEPACVKAESLGCYELVDSPITKYFLNDFYWASSVTSSSLSNEKRAKVISVYNDAVEYIRKEPEKAQAILAKYTGLKPELANKVAIPIFLKSNEWNEAGLNRAISAFDKAGLLK